MNDVPDASPFLQREILINALYEAAELEHNLMCTYLYAAASLKSGEGEGLSVGEAAAVKRWRGVLLDVAIQEMGHLAAVWNITSALGASRTTTFAGSAPGSSGKFSRPNRGLPPSAEVMFHTAVRCPISSMATAAIVRRHLLMASASVDDTPGSFSSLRLNAAYR